MVLLFQTDILGSVIWFLLFFVMIFLYPRMMLAQLIYKLEESATKMETMSQQSIKMTLDKAVGKGKASKELRTKVENFTDIFVVVPSSLDPFGVVRKIDQTIRGMEDRFDEFTDDISTSTDYHERQKLNYGLRAAVGLRQISKMIRHYVETAKKFKNLQIAMIIQMQLPMIEKIAESELAGTEAFIQGWPVGDSIGPLAAASLVEKSKEIAEDVVCGETMIQGRRCFVLKAKGPSPHLGRVDEAINTIMKKNKIARVITIDAGLKLEGEKTGSVVEGIGFAMGGWAQREMIENMLLPKNMPIDGVVVKVGMEEAIMPMSKDVYGAVPDVHRAVERAVQRAKKQEKVIIIGVGNSCGVGDTKKIVPGVEKIVQELHKKAEEAKKKQKKNKWF
ncbi:MAG: DUF1512 family protein [Candidatus Aenigmarchaeota archaeon]|nr:DUF1512 family protein [Candidatus Aenigmarchaeota archaeon]